MPTVVVCRTCCLSTSLCKLPLRKSGKYYANISRKSNHTHIAHKN